MHRDSGEPPGKKRFLGKLTPREHKVEAHAHTPPPSTLAEDTTPALSVEEVVASTEAPAEKPSPAVEALVRLGLSQEMGINIQALANEGGQPDGWSAAELQKHIEGGAEPFSAGVLVLSSLSNWRVVNQEVDAFARRYQIEQKDATKLQMAATGTRARTTYILECLGSHMEVNWNHIHGFVKDLWETGVPWSPYIPAENSRPTATLAAEPECGLPVRAQVEEAQRAAVLAAERIAERRAAEERAVAEQRAAAEQQEQAAAQRAAAEQAAGKERAAAEWAAVVRAAAVEAAVEAVRRAEEKVSRETEELEARRQELVQLRNENR